MISFQDAQALVMSLARALEPELRPIEAASGRVLAAPLAASFDRPATPVSAMDGYAVRDADMAAGTRLRIVGRSFPGAGFDGRLAEGTCVRVFTGAPVPANADRVVVQEVVRETDGFAVIEEAPSPRRHIRARGSDFRAGEILLPAGRRLDARAMVVAGAADVSHLPVVRRPRLSLLAYLVAAVSDTLGQFPDFNASLDPDGKTLYRKAYRNIGIAVDTPMGLLVPVLHNVQGMDLAAVARGIETLSDRARTGRLKNTDIEGGSFTVTSLGKLGGTGFAPIVNAPEVAILGVARAQERPVVRAGVVVVRLMLPLSLSYDHRVIDGAAAGRFLAELQARLRTDS